MQERVQHRMKAMESQVPAANIGSSVVSVQELIKQPIKAVPERYVQRDQEPQIVSDDGRNGAPVIPVIDLGKLSSDQTEGDHELEKLHEACKDLGLFQVSDFRKSRKALVCNGSSQLNVFSRGVGCTFAVLFTSIRLGKIEELVNHGIGSSLLEDLRHEIEEFFNLPLSEKMKFGIRSGEVEGYGSVTLSEEKFDWGDRLFMIVNPIEKRKPHLFPELPLSLRSTLEGYIKETQKLAMQLFCLISKCLGIKTNEMKELFEDGLQTMRTTYYPPCPQPELVVGLRPHSDATGITILHQVNGVDGLEIKKDGVWTPIHILPNAFIVNVGDTMEILTNGLYNSIEHRATVNSIKERISIARFFNPKMDAEIGPIQSLTTKESPALYRRIKMERYVKEFFSSHKLDGKSNVEKMKIGPEKGCCNLQLKGSE